MLKISWVLLPLCFVIVFFNSDKVLYKSDVFTVYYDRVEQGDFSAIAESATHIVSDYKSPDKMHYSSTIAFKFAINGNDNEAPSGKDHYLTIMPEQGKYVSPVITFGEEDPKSFIKDNAEETLEPNTEFIVQVDMNEVLQEFENKGSYTTWSGEEIPESAFKGVYIAGGSEPFSWDFDNLQNNPDYKLRDEDGNGIYEGRFILNPYDPEADKNKEWTLQSDISRYPTFESDQLLINALYNMSLDETIMLIEKDGTFRTGEEWAGVWTRDISYSVLLSYAFLQPEISRTSLMQKVNRDRIIQDTGSGGAWPVSTDRVVWSLAAWEIYAVTGDRDWLTESYQIIKNTIEDDFENNIYNKKMGLFKGESSFLDWREQTYPGWMDNVDISQSLNLGTNTNYYRTLVILSEMAAETGDSSKAEYYADLASNLKSAINEQLWNEEKGYYNQYFYGRHYYASSPRFEALGASLSILFGIADKEKADRIISEAPVISYGVPTIYPQIPNIPPYHNNGIWPFVQSYWNWAAAKSKNEEALNKGLGSLYRSAALFVTNKENFVAETGDFAGTQINSDRQLWSVAGNLAMIYRIFLGMEFEPQKINLFPVIPEAYAGTKTIKNFKYRDAVLNFTIEGYGDQIKGMEIDGRSVSAFEISSDTKGEHHIRIKMNNSFEQSGTVQVVENTFSPERPLVKITDSMLSWEEVNNASSYQIYRNGERHTETESTGFNLKDEDPGIYQVMTTGSNGITSFLSEPVFYYSEENSISIEPESIVEAQQDIHLSNVRGNGAIETSYQTNQTVLMPVNIDKPGRYLLSVRYSNGSGPWNTDNKCAIRTLYVNDHKQGTLVLAQRGAEEWSNWGTSNYIVTDLKKGENIITLSLEEHNTNMNVEVNKALIDQINLIEL